MTTATFILYTHNTTAKGHPIKIRVHNQKHKYVNLKEYSTKEDWGEGNVKRSHPDYRRLHNKLMRRSTLLEEQLQFCERHRLNLDDSYNLIKEGLNREMEIMLLRKRLKELEQQGSIGLLEFMDVLLKENYNRTTFYFRNFLENNLDIDIPLNDITYEWLNQFVISQKGKRESTIKKYIDRIKTVYLEAQKRESLGIKKEDPFIGLKITGKPSKEKYEFEDFERFSNNLELDYVAMFVFQFVIGGHDLVDVANLSWSNIKKGRATFKRYKNRTKKNGGPKVDNKLFPLANKIIELHGNKDSERIFDFIPCPIEKDSEYNDYRSMLFYKLVKFYGKGRIGFKTPRHAFRTRAGNMLINEFVITTLMGHTPSGITFDYQRALPYEVLDSEHAKIIKF